VPDVVGSAKIKIIPDTSGFSAALRVQLKGIRTPEVKVKLKADPIGFTASIRDAVKGVSANPIKIKMAVDATSLNKSAMAAAKGIKTAAVPVGLKVSAKGVQSELNAFAKGLKLRSVQIQAKPDLKGFDAALRGLANGVKAPSIKVLAKPDLTGFSTELRNQLKKVSQNIKVRIDPDLNQFGKAVSGAMVGVSKQAKQALVGVGVADASRQMRAAGAEAASFRSRLDQMSHALSRSGERALLMGQALTYGVSRPLIQAGKNIVETASQFELSLKTASAVAADFTGNTPEAIADFGKQAKQTFDQLSVKALEFSRTTKFSANEVADAFVELARAGIQGESTLSGVFRTIANVATVEGAEVNQVAEGLIKVFTGFGGSLSTSGLDVKSIFGGVRPGTADALASEFERAGDILAVTSAKTTTNITDLVTGFRYAGPVAAAVGLTFEETAASLGLLAQAGFDASLGGTALRGIITRLIIPTKQNAEIFTKLGISMEEARGEVEADGTSLEELTKIHVKYGLQVLDSTGKMKPLTEILSFLDAKGISTADAMKLFAQRAGPGLLALIGQTPGALEKLTKGLQNAGGASEAMANIIKNTASFQFSQLKNAMQELFILVGESGVLAFFSNLATNLASFARSIAETNPEIFKLVFGVGAFIAALGPVLILLGFFHKGLQAGLAALSALVSPFAAAVAAMGIFIGFLALAYAQSEALRSALAPLVDLFGIVLPVALGVARDLLGGIIGVVGGLAGALGDTLAPKILELAVSIRDWVADGSMLKFFSTIYDGAIEASRGILELVGALGGFYQSLGSNAELQKFVQTLQGIGRGIVDLVRGFFDITEQMTLWESVSAAGLKIWEQMEPVLDVAKATLFALWSILKLAASVFESLLLVIKPLTGILGDLFIPLLFLMTIRMLALKVGTDGAGGRLEIFGKRVATAGDGLRYFSSQAARVVSLNALATNVGTLGLKLEEMGSSRGGLNMAGNGLKNFISVLANGNFGTRLATIGGSVANMADRVLQFGNRASDFASKIGPKLKAAFADIGNAGANAGTALQGFFAGSLAASADTLTEKITATAIAVTSLFQAASTGNPLLVVLTLIGIAAGAAVKLLNQASPEFAGIGSQIETLFDEIKSGNGKISGDRSLEIFASQMDALDPNNMASIGATLSLLGTNVGDLGESFVEGGNSAVEFYERLRDAYGDKSASKDINSLLVQVDDLRMLNEAGAQGFKVGDIVDPKDIDRVAGLGISLKLVRKDGLALGHDVQQAFSGLTDLVGDAFLKGEYSLDRFKKAAKLFFDKELGGDALRKFAEDSDRARAQFAVMEPLIKKSEEAQRSLASGSKDWLHRLEDVNAVLDETKRRLRELIPGQEDAKESTAALFDVIKENIDSLKIGAGGGVVFSRDAIRADQKGAKGAFDALRAISGSAADLKAELGKDLFGSDAFKVEEFNKRWTTLRDSVFKFATAPDGPLKLSNQQAQELVDKLLGVNAMELQATLRLGVTGDNDAQLVAEIMRKAGQGTEENAAKFTAVIQGRIAGPLSADQITKLTGGVQAQANLNVLLDVVRGAPPAGWTWEQIAPLIAGGSLRVGSLQSDLEILGKTIGGPLSPDQVAALIAFGVVSIGKIQAFLEILPSVGPIAGITADQKQLILGDLLKDNASQQQIDLVFKTLEQNPGVIDSVLKLMQMEGIKAIDIPVAIQAAITLDPAGITGLDVEGLKQLSIMVGNIAAAAGLGGNAKAFSDGGIVGSEIFARIGEAGPEVIIPLTKPDRAASLLQESGLYQFAVRTAIKGGEVPTDVAFAASGIFSGDFLDPAALPAVPSVGGAAGSSIQLPGGAGVAGPAVGDVHVSIVLHIVGLEEVIAGFQTAVAIATFSFDSIQSASSIMALNVVNYVTAMVHAFLQIPSAMAIVSRSIANGFRNPIAFIGSSVWPPFANLINRVSDSFGVGIAIPTSFAVPTFHSGGVVGEGGTMTDASDLNSMEMMAKLQRGEGVMSREMMANMTKGQLQAFRGGERRWWAAGDSRSTGKAHVEGRKDAVGSTIKRLNLDQYRTDFEGTVSPMLAALMAGYSNDASARIGDSSIRRLNTGIIDYSEGANEAIQREMTARIPGLPEGFDLQGAVPDGFDVGHWREFLGANKRPGSYPLLMQYLQAAGVPYLVNSTFRPGGTSYHASSRAVDFGAPGDANYDSPGLLRIDRAFAPMLGVLSELIYSGPGGVSDKAYDGATMAAHHNHVHAALANGGVIDQLTYAMLGERGREVVLPLDSPGRALDLAFESGLFRVLADAQMANASNLRTGGVVAPAGAARSGGVGSPRSTSPSGSFDGGPLGGGPGNTYHINGVDMTQVKAEIRARDQAAMRKRK